ncbi:hypothetical protein [Petropleomorpha daqingensis]|uniref:Repeat domain-containing protein n=1 Tax=Petropleomorpha daqingensis TaxID=2026353 RepID=A0A853CGC0_9ACTN|nr:hypothetical protein [Petropleomorpha daqingensis]NYJ07005.1 hypothetical protein [Petropleomorpha daqingensis]
MRFARVAVSLLAPLVVAGCASSGGSSGASGTSSSSAPSSVSSASSSAPSSSAPAGGCTAKGATKPAGAVTKPTLDVDGDGKPDTLWIAKQPEADGGVPFGITTAAGGTFGTTIRSASPVARSVMVADVTGKGELIALASDNRQVLLYGISSCSFVPELNAGGQQYAFDLGFTGYGTGVGCVDANGDGTTDLVGLKYQPESNGAGTISRTIITLDGPQARNGATDTVTVTRASEADEAQSVGCGDVTLAEDGVTTGP